MQTPSDLPPYAATPLGRALIDEIIASPPPSRLIRDDWGVRDHPTYAGKPAGLLRKLHKQWVQREYSRLDRHFAITHHWDADEAEAILRAEQSDALIHRVLAEAAHGQARAA